MKTSILHKTKKGLTALLLGASSVAMAQPFAIKEDLYDRHLNRFTVAHTYNADSLLWEFQSYSGGGSTTSRHPDFLIETDGYLTLKVYAPTGLFTKSHAVRFINYVDYQGNTPDHPFTDSLVTSTNGLQLSVPSYLHADSVKWKVRNDLTHDSSTFWQIGSETITPITVTQNATVTAWVRTEGVWYKQLIQFNGVTQNSVSGLLQAPVVTNGTYVWYFENEVLAASGTSCTPTQIGTYKVVITWPSSSPNARLSEEGNKAEFVFEVTELPTTPDVFTEVSDLYTRYRNFVAVSPNYLADSTFWEFSSWNESLSEFEITTSRIKSFNITKDGHLTLKAYTRTGLFSKTSFIRYIKSDGIGSDITKPFTDSLVIASNGLQLSAYSFLRADSVAWKVRNDITHDSTYVLYTGTEVNTPIIVTQNATVTAWVRTEGVWYKQLIQFNGITQSSSGEIQAPVISNATYLWYFEDTPLGVTGASYVPTENGTYKVIITWPTPNNARLADGSNRAEFVFEVTNVVTTDLDNAAMDGSSLTLYPNPASESLHISNVRGEYEYSIKNAIGNEVARGTSTGDAALNISQLNSGLYVVSIKAAGTEVTKKLMVK